MPGKQLKVKLSAIAKEIDKATKQLKGLRSKVAPKAKKRLNLEIKDLKKARKLVAEHCHLMTSIFPGA
jgi:DNA repair ATPase RecN